MIEGPFSEDYFWYDESESDPEFLDHWDDTLSAQSNNDWGWDEWGDLVVFRPVGQEPAYRYPLVIWISQDETPGVTLRDWFPDLSDRNYIGAEVQWHPEESVALNADRVALTIREVSALYGIHMQRIWIGGMGPAANLLTHLMPHLTSIVAGFIVIDPEESKLSGAAPQPKALGRSLYLATHQNHENDSARSYSERWKQHGGRCRLSSWESFDHSRMALCRDLNVWLMEQVCAPVPFDSRG